MSVLLDTLAKLHPVLQVLFHQPNEGLGSACSELPSLPGSFHRPEVYADGDGDRRFVQTVTDAYFIVFSYFLL